MSLGSHRLRGESMDLDNLSEKAQVGLGFVAIGALVVAGLVLQYYLGVGE